jgi:Sulfotransferase family
MVISHRRRFVFIHVYKTGGTSISRALLPHARIVDQLAERFTITRFATHLIDGTFNLWDARNHWLTGLTKHATAREVRAYLGAGTYSSYRSFAFVRNPWDWQYSNYHFIRRWTPHRDHALARSLPFNEFLALQVDQGTPTQSDFITDDRGEIIVDRVGRFEAIDTDFGEIVDELGLHISGLQHLNRSHYLNRYIDAYSAETINMVRSYFRCDIERFGYDFGK